MCLWDDLDDPVAIAQMTSDLRHAQVGLRSAQCATDRLRQHFSVRRRGSLWRAGLTAQGDQQRRRCARPF